MRFAYRLLISALFAFNLALVAQPQGLIRDAEIESILREWTDPILEVAGLNPEDVELYIIQDKTLNAFVANGARIHLHTGLLIAAETPGQIKGVIGHEICHIACGHTVTRSRAQRTAMGPALVSIGLGVLAMASGSGEAGAALFASAQQFAALNFFIHTRAEEATADAAAVEYLSQLGESPAGIVEFFENFRYQEILSDTRRDPYFRVHPIAASRIRTTRQLAEETGLMDVPPTQRAQDQYVMMRAKLIGFLEPTQRTYQLYPMSDQSQPARYARSIAAMQAADVKEALREVKLLIDNDPENPYFHELHGQILFESGRVADSVEPHAKSLEYAPTEPLFYINYARSLSARGEEGDYEKSEIALSRALDYEPDNSFAWAQLAFTMERLGRRSEAELATAEAAYHIGNLPRANAFARRAIIGLKKDTPLWHRADDIVATTDPVLAEAFQSRRRLETTPE